MPSKSKKRKQRVSLSDEEKFTKRRFSCTSSSSSSVSLGFDSKESLSLRNDSNARASRSSSISLGDRSGSFSPSPDLCPPDNSGAGSSHHESRSPSPDDSGFSETSSLVFDAELAGHSSDSASLGDSSDDDDDDLPVRVLDDFIIANANTRETVEFDFLMDVQEICVSGVTYPHAESSDSDSDTGSEDLTSSSNLRRCAKRIKIKTVLELWIDPEFIDLRLWLRTPHAWYILQKPSKQYRNFYATFFVSFILAALVVGEAQDDRRSTITEFKEALKNSKVDLEVLGTIKIILGKPFQTSIIEDLYMQSRVSNLLKWSANNGKGLRGLHRVPLLVHFLKFDPFVFESRRVRHSDDVEDNALSQRFRTVVTRTVGKIAQGLFARSLLIAGQDSAGDARLENASNICVSEPPFVAHHKDPIQIKWGEPHNRFPTYYNSVFLDGVEYHIGDTVIVAAGEDDNRARATNAKLVNLRSKDARPSSFWFCQIIYFYEKGGKKLFHCRWFEHGSYTLLAETANPQGLFLIDECSDNPVACIVQKCRIRKLGQGEPEPVIISDEDIGSDSFHFRYVWDGDQLAFRDPDLEDHGICARLNEPCYVCALEIDLQNSSFCVKTQKSLTIYRKEYHAYDFVYIRHQFNGLLSIAQILDLKISDESAIVVQSFLRFEDHPGDYLTVSAADYRQLVPNGHRTVQASQLDGHCTVMTLDEIIDLDSYITTDDHFFVDFQKTVKRTSPGYFSHEWNSCDKCRALEQKAAQKEKKVTSKDRKLRTMDLFSGAGGLSAGLELSGFVKTCWAIEHSPAAAATFAANHPDAMVYNHDTNILLKHAIETFEKKNPKLLHSLHGNTRLPPLPVPGEVDMIVGGPPCQPFSGMNRNKHVDDIRNTMITNMMSYVEFYHPKFVLVENVTGMINYRLQATQVGKKFVGGIEGGILKFVARALTSLGYTLHMKVLNSAQHGSPQQRRRIFIWGARLGEPLPPFPIPTNFLEKAKIIRKLSTIGSLVPSSRSTQPDEEVPHSCAPLPFISIQDSISDLPGFDWKNPHAIADIARRHESVVDDESDRPYPSVRADLRAPTRGAGYIEPVAYSHRPRTPYQAWIRKGLTRNAKVSLHYTRLYAVDVVERTVNIGMFPGADLQTLPPYLLKANRQSDEGLAKGKGTYTRLDATDTFRTALTVVSPNSRAGSVLHPQQKRVLTIRECARAQGFHDKYEFKSLNKYHRKQIEDIFKQIGNAVPVPLAYALGRSLGLALTSQHEEQETKAPDWEDMSSSSVEL